MDVDDDGAADRSSNHGANKKAQRDPELKGISLLAHWNLVDYLPEQLQEPFEVIIGEFILNPWKWRKKELERRKKEAAAGTVEFKDVTSEEYDNFVKNIHHQQLDQALVRFSS